MQQTITFALLALVSFLIGAVHQQSIDRDMAVCQLSHSFDVCHSTLNP